MLDESPRTHNKGIRTMRIPFTLLATSLAGLPSPAETAPGSIKDIVYARVDGHELKLDLHLPGDKKKPPLVVWVHGGAWRSGSKDNPPLLYLLNHGYAIASVDYRLSPVAKYPALIHDCKGAIRWLRAKAETHGYNASRIGIAGSSAGGHMVALIGVTNGSRSHEGTVGGNLQQSSNVQAIVDLYGPTNFLTILHQSTPHGLSVRVPALKLLLGERPEDAPELARLASPVFHVDKSDPPLLMLHGDQDPQVPINQSHELHAAYKKLQLDSHLEVIHGGVHGGHLFHDAVRRKLVTKFLDAHLKKDATP